MEDELPLEAVKLHFMQKIQSIYYGNIISKWALDVPTAAAAVANFQQIMMQRFKFMEQMQVNNVYKIKDKEVNYYEVSF